jgi:hypothetical protein
MGQIKNKNMVLVTLWVGTRTWGDIAASAACCLATVRVSWTSQGSKLHAV